MATTVLPGPASRLEDVHQVLLGRGVDPRDGLVEQVEVGVRRQGTGQEHATSLAAGQRADLAMRRASASRPSRGPPSTRRDRARAGRRPMPIRGTRPIITTVADRHREVPVDDLRLRDVGDATRRDAGAPPRTSTRPATAAEQPGDDLEQRALAGTVRSDHGEERARSARRGRRRSRASRVAVARPTTPVEPDGRVGRSTPGAGRRRRGGRRPIIGACRRALIAAPRRSGPRSSASSRDTCRPARARGRRCRAS